MPFFLLEADWFYVWVSKTIKVSHYVLLLASRAIGAILSYTSSWEWWLIVELGCKLQIMCLFLAHLFSLSSSLLFFLLFIQLFYKHFHNPPVIFIVTQVAFPLWDYLWGLFQIVSQSLIYKNGLIHDENAQQSRFRGNITQHNKGLIWKSRLTSYSMGKNW